MQTNFTNWQVFSSNQQQIRYIKCKQTLQIDEFFRQINIRWLNSIEFPL